MAAFESAACNHGGKDFAPMPPAAVPWLFPLHFWSAPKFPAAPNDGAFEQSVIRQILQESGEAFVELGQLPAQDASTMRPGSMPGL